MTDWKTVAAARGVKISQEDLIRVGPAMDRHRKEFSELLKAIQMELLPATIVAARPVQAETSREDA